MVDFHSHILPDMDDGSRNAEESLQMLKRSYAMGVDTIVSTSHFYAYHESIEAFLSRRNERLNYLAHMFEGTANVPKIVEGAEVAFYSGMCSYEELPRLCIGNTKCMLIEMPYCSWSSIDKKELLSMIFIRGIKPIIAHVDRYFGCRKNVDMIEELMDFGAVAQINSECLISDIQKKRALKLIKERKAVLLGSDCHNMHDRRPNLDKAYAAIEKNLGKLYINKTERFSRELLASYDIDKPTFAR